MRLLNNPNTDRITPAPERFTMVIGTTYRIALAYPDGKRYPGSRPGLPDSVMFTLVDGRRAWFPVEVAALIDQLNLISREPFTICNHGTRRGWEVKRDVVPEEPPVDNVASPARVGAHDIASEYSPNHAPTASPQANVPATKLEHALKTAIAAARNAERYASEIGYPLRFDAEAIKAMAITVLINAEGGRK